MSLRLTLALPFIFIVTAAACQDPRGRCEQSVLPTCDPHDADCQRALHEHVACVRGVDPDSEPPTFEFIGADEYHARYDHLPEPPPDQKQCFYLAGLWPYMVTEDVAEPTARFDVDRRRIVVVDGAAPEDVQAPLLRAIAQAQRDDELDGFATWRAEHGRTLDQRTALEALFFGEGWLFGDAAALKTRAMSDEELRALVRDELDDYADDEDRLLGYARSRLYDYRYVGITFAAAGARFALRSFLAGDAAIAEAFARPVTSSAELTRRRLTDTPPAEPGTGYTLPPGYIPRATDRLGASAYHAFLSRVDPLPLALTNERRQRYHTVAGRWMGDRFDCAINPSIGSALVVWELAFDPGVELDLFTMTAHAPGDWRWVEGEHALYLVGGDQEEVVNAVVAAFEPLAAD